ncbi:STAS domain-containing protein [Streptomyces sp. NPDC059894]|uniref:STAS domain-containing protein n=1 Tax=unclassified Streptomyces TaxID=2593676 RepID=UPI00365F544D
MSTHPSFHVTTRASRPGALTVAIGGELDYDTSGLFLALVTGALDAHAREHGAAPRDLRLDCAALTVLDSTGLSALLMLRRRTHPEGIALHLDNRPAHLVRMLDVTGTADHLTGRSCDASPPLAGRHADESGTAPAT